MAKKSRRSRTYEVEYVRDPETKAYDQLYDVTQSEKLKRKLDEFQKPYYEGLHKNRCIFVDASSGTGKTTIAFIVALEKLRTGSVSKVMYVRFPSKRTQGLGFLPGDLSEKEFAYFKPAYGTLNKLGLQSESINLLREKGLLEFTTDATMRGEDYEDRFIIIDEAQNSMDLEELQLVLTRPHDNCTVAVIGHSKQLDSNVRRYVKNKYNAFQIYQKHMLKKKWTRMFELRIDYRGELSRHADNVQETLIELEEQEG